MKSVLVILRRVYLDLVEGNHCAAKLIEYFKHWREWKLKNHRTEWVYMPVRQIYEDLMQEHSVGIIRRAIALLVELGLLEQRHNPGNGQDRTWQYRLNQKELESKLKLENADVTDETPSVKSDQCSTHDQSSSIKSNSEEGILEEYEDKLKTYSIYVHSWDGENVIPNPRMQSVLRVLTKIPRRRAEAAIEAFLAFLRRTSAVENKYEKLEQALRQGWQT